MNIIDALVILIIIIMAIIGFKRGFIHSVVSFVGTILVVILAFIFKNIISVVLYENLPFFKFSGFFKNVSVINILFYEVIAFIIALIVLGILLKIFIKVSKLIEKIFKVTIILGIPSKIAGALFGIVEGYVISFVMLYIFSLSIFNIVEMQNSKYRDHILNDTPILSSLSDDALVMIKDFEALKEDYNSSKSAEEFNLETLDLFLKYKIISIESVDKLVERNKLQIDNIESVLQKYRNDDKNKENVEIIENSELEVNEESAKEEENNVENNEQEWWF